MKNDEQRPIERRTIYDGIRISKKGADTIVFILSLTLVIILSVAIILSAKL